MTTSKVLLIVDDSRVSRLIIKGRILMARPNWTIHEAGNADEATALAKSSSPDFISMDVNMPGANGFEVVEQLRAMGSTATVVMLTANIQQSNRDRAANMGVHFVQKPATETALHQMLMHFESSN